MKIDQTNAQLRTKIMSLMSYKPILYEILKSNPTIIPSKRANEIVAEAIATMFRAETPQIGYESAKAELDQICDTASTP